MTGGVGLAMSVNSLRTCPAVAANEVSDSEGGPSSQDHHRPVRSPGYRWRLVPVAIEFNQNQFVIMIQSSPNSYRVRARLAATTDASSRDALPRSRAVPRRQS